MMKKFIGVLIVIVALVGVKMFYIDRSAKQEVERHLSKMEDHVQVSYNTAKIDLLGWNTHLQDVTMSPAGMRSEINVEDIIIYDIEEQQELPTRLHVEFKGVKMEVNQENFGRNVKDLQRMGYKRLQGTLEIDYAYDLEKKDFRLKTFRLGAKDVGHVSVEFHLSKVDLSSLDMFSLLMSFPNMLLHDAEFRYEDDSLVPRLQKLAAEDQGLSVDELVKEMSETIEKEIGREKNEFTRDGLKAVKKFVNDPDEIKIIMSPKKPVSAGEIQKTKPTLLPERLNIKITT